MAWSYIFIYRLHVHILFQYSVIYRTTWILCLWLDIKLGLSSSHFLSLQSWNNWRLDLLVSFIYFLCLRNNNEAQTFICVSFWQLFCMVLHFFVSWHLMSTKNSRLGMPYYIICWVSVGVCHLHYTIFQLMWHINWKIFYCVHVYWKNMDSKKN